MQQRLPTHNNEPKARSDNAAKTAKLQKNTNNQQQMDEQHTL